MRKAGARAAPALTTVKPPAAAVPAKSVRPPVPGNNKWRARPSTSPGIPYSFQSQLVHLCARHRFRYRYLSSLILNKTTGHIGMRNYIVVPFVQQCRRLVACCSRVRQLLERQPGVSHCLRHPQARSQEQAKTCSFWILLDLPACTLPQVNSAADLIGPWSVLYGTSWKMFDAWTSVKDLATAQQSAYQSDCIWQGFTSSCRLTGWATLFRPLFSDAPFSPDRSDAEQQQPSPPREVQAPKAAEAGPTPSKASQKRHEEERGVAEAAAAFLESLDRTNPTVHPILLLAEPDCRYCLGMITSELLMHHAASPQAKPSNLTNGRSTWHAFPRSCAATLTEGHSSCRREGPALSRSCQLAGAS